MKTKNLVIAGSARCVWDDLEMIWPIDCDVMAVNDMTMHYPEKLTYAYNCAKAAMHMVRQLVEQGRTAIPRKTAPQGLYA